MIILTLMRKVIFLLFCLGPLSNAKSAVLLAKNSIQDIDTTVVEDIDAADIFVSIRFDYINGDTAKSSAMQKRQEVFLKKLGMPISGEEEMRTNMHYDFEELDRTYKTTLERLAGQGYKDLYRQVCSQLLVKNYCAKNITSEYNLKYPNNKLKFYLDEMKNTKSTNIGLIYTSFIKFQYKNNQNQLCNAIKSYLPFLYDTLTEAKIDLTDFSDLMKNDQDILLEFMLRQMNTKYLSDKQYVEKIERMGKKACINK